MRKIGFIVILFVTLAATAVQAGVIVQGSSSQYIAFETEDNFTPNSSPDWVVTSDANASNGKALLASAASATRGEATYQLKFSTAGEYSFFPRLRSTVSGSNADSHDSFMVSVDGGDYFSVNQHTNGTSYFWNTGITSTLTIGASDIGRSIPVTLQIKVDKVMVDRIVFSTVISQDNNSLDGLANSPVETPEPTGATILATVLLGALARRRR
jgi:hypothetical protein